MELRTSHLAVPLRRSSQASMEQLETMSAGGPPPGSVEVRVETDAVRITLAGEIDASLSAELDDAAQQAYLRGLPVVVDAGAVTFMDSTGASFFVGLLRASGPVTANLSPPVRSLLDVIGLGEQF